jgi:hypothetical protein
LNEENTVAWNPLLQRSMAALLSMTIGSATLAQTAPSSYRPADSLPALIPTEQFGAAVAVRSGDSARQHLLDTLDRADVVAALIKRGLDPDQARDRVAVLTDAQAVDFAAQIDRAPAGSSEVLSAALFIFVLLLVTDILGFTKVFPFTRAVR